MFQAKEIDSVIFEVKVFLITTTDCLTPWLIQNPLLCLWIYLQEYLLLHRYTSCRKKKRTVLLICQQIKETKSYIYIYTNIYIFTHTYLYTYNINIYIYIYITHTHTHMHIYITCKYVFTSACTHARTHAYTQVLCCRNLVPHLSDFLFSISCNLNPTSVRILLHCSANK